MMNTSELVSALIIASERAGNIARICRQDENLLSLLVQEKKDSEKNPRFTTDFKTLADVLVQEMVKHELCSQVNTNIEHYNSLLKFVLTLLYNSTVKLFIILLLNSSIILIF